MIACHIIHVLNNGLYCLRRCKQRDPGDIQSSDILRVVRVNYFKCLSLKVVCLSLQHTQYLTVQAKRDFSGTAGRMNRILSSKSGIQHWCVQCRLLQDVLQNVSGSSLSRKLAWVLLPMNKNDLPLAGLIWLLYKSSKGLTVTFMWEIYLELEHNALNGIYWGKFCLQTAFFFLNTLI